MLVLFGLILVKSNNVILDLFNCHDMTWSIHKSLLTFYRPRSEASEGCVFIGIYLSNSGGGAGGQHQRFTPTWSTTTTPLGHGQPSTPLPLGHGQPLLPPPGTWSTTPPPHLGYGQPPPLPKSCYLHGCKTINILVTLPSIV